MTSCYRSFFVANRQANANRRPAGLRKTQGSAGCLAYV